VETNYKEMASATAEVDGVVLDFLVEHRLRELGLLYSLVGRQDLTDLEKQTVGYSVFSPEGQHYLPRSEGSDRVQRLSPSVRDG